MNCGIYYIKVKGVTIKGYVGSSKHLHTRYKQHLYLL